MGLMDAGEVVIKLVRESEPKLVAAIAERLSAFNAPFAGPPKFRPLVVALEDAKGEVLGGLVGETVYGWLSIQMLFVPKALRGRGMGSALIRHAEEEARVRGCLGMVVNTFSFQARPFYERLGFVHFGTLDDCPPGHRCYYLRKSLHPR